MNENNSDKLSLPQALDHIKDREKKFLLGKNQSCRTSKTDRYYKGQIKTPEKNKFKEKQHGLQI